MDSDAIDAIIAALEKAGHQIGAPALEHAVQAVQISGAVGIMSGAVFAVAACGGAFFAVRTGAKARTIRDERGDDWRDREALHIVGASVAGVVAAVAAVAGIVSLFGSGWVKLLSPLGYIVAKTIGA